VPQVWRTVPLLPIHHTPQRRTVVTPVQHLETANDSGYRQIAANNAWAAAICVQLTLTDHRALQACPETPYQDGMEIGGCTSHPIPERVGGKSVASALQVMQPRHYNRKKAYLVARSLDASYACRGLAPGYGLYSTAGEKYITTILHQIYSNSHQVLHNTVLQLSRRIVFADVRYPMEQEHRDLFDLGLQADLTMLQQSPLTRRRLLKLGLVGITSFLAGCTPFAGQSSTPTGGPTSTSVAGSGSVSSPTALPASPTALPASPTVAATVSTPTTAVTPTSAPVAECVSPIPTETAGPFPGDGSQGASLNVLARSGVVRQDIRTSLGTGNLAAGIPLRLELKLVRAGGDCAPLAGYALYAWHCDAQGRYSMYSSGVEGEDYLRGVQAADANGIVVFQTIFPGCYSGRWPHVHFEIYPSLDQATSARNVVHTSQLALPEDICRQVYADPQYGNSLNNLGRISLERDGIFRDGWQTQMATVTGSLNDGLVARLTIGVPGV